MFVFRIPTNKKEWDKQLADSLVRIKQQLHITITHYQKQTFHDVYSQASKICMFLNLLFAYNF